MTLIKSKQPKLNNMASNFQMQEQKKQSRANDAHEHLGKKEIFTVHKLVMVTKNSFTLTKINGKALGDNGSMVVEGWVASHVIV